MLIVNISIDICCDRAGAIDVCRRGQGRRDRQITGALHRDDPARRGPHAARKTPFAQGYRSGRSFSNCPPDRRIIRVMLPSKPRGVPRVDDRRVLNGIFWVLPSGAPWRDLPDIYGPRTTCYNRFIRWRRADIWESIMNALAAAHDAVLMIDTSMVRVHQHAACIADSANQAVGRSRGGLTSKLHVVVDSNGCHCGSR